MNNLIRRYPDLLGSSADPTQLALTIKGILVGITPLILIFFGLAKIDIGQEDWEQFMELIYQLVIYSTGLISLGATLYGLGRKVYYRIKR